MRRWNEEKANGARTKKQLVSEGLEQGGRKQCAREHLPLKHLIIEGLDRGERKQEERVLGVRAFQPHTYEGVC